MDALVEEAREKRHYLVLVEQLAREGKSQQEIEAAMKQLTDENRSLREKVRSLLGASTRKAA